MAINDPFMLPQRVRTMAQMAELLDTEQAELTQMQRTITAQENQLTISTSTFLLPRHEKMFDLPVNTTESLEVRRARLVAKLNTKGTTTNKAIREMVRIVMGCEGDVEEHFADYAFTVNVHLLPESGRFGVQELAKQIEEIKPGHLVFDIAEDFHSIILEHGNLVIIARLKLPFRISNGRQGIVRFDGEVNLDGSLLLDQAIRGLAMSRQTVTMGISHQEEISITIDSEEV